MLMGVGVTAVLASVRTTLEASDIDRNHAIAYEWLQSASDEIYRRDRLPCDTYSHGAIIAAYDASARSVERPPGWDAASGASIQVEQVEYLGRADQADDFVWDSSYCFEGGTEYADSPLYTQRVTLRAYSPNAEFTRTLQMVKSE